MNSSAQLQSSAITLAKLKELILPIRDYFTSAGAINSLMRLGQAEENLVSGKPADLEAAIDTIRELHFRIPLEEVNVRESSIVLRARTRKYYCQAQEYNQN